MKHVDISTKTILKVIFIPLSLYLIWMNRDLVFAFFIAFIIMSALRPVVIYLNVRRNVSRPLASLFVVLTALVVIAVLVGTIVPPILSETIGFIEKLPETLRQLDPAILRYVNVQEISRLVPDFANQIMTIVGNVFSNTFLVAITLFFSYYLLANEHHIERQFIEGVVSRHMDEKKVKKFIQILHSAQTRLAAWFWGELFLMFVIGFVSYIGFSWIGLKYALPLAVLAGLLEAVPNIGPIVATIFATLIGFGQAPIIGFAALAIEFAIQQLEGYFLVPYIMKKAVGLNPFITMISLIMALRLAGPLGAIVAIPTYVLLESIYLEIYQKPIPQE